MWDKLEPIDIIAIIILISGFILIAMGVDHAVSGIIIMVVSYYFGKKSSGIIKLPK